MFSFLKKIVGYESELDKCNKANEFIKHGTIEQKIEYLKINYPEMAKWIQEHYEIDKDKMEKIIKLAVVKFIYINLFLPYFKNQFQSYLNIDEQLLNLEVRKANELSDINWQMSFDAAKRK